LLAVERVSSEPVSAIPCIRELLREFAQGRHPAPGAKPAQSQHSRGFPAESTTLTRKRNRELLRAEQGVRRRATAMRHPSCSARVLGTSTRPRAGISKSEAIACARHPLGPQRCSARPHRIRPSQRLDRRIEMCYRMPSTRIIRHARRCAHVLHAAESAATTPAPGGRRNAQTLARGPRRFRRVLGNESSTRRVAPRVSSEAQNRV
jgi:hypothetical protein